MLSIIVAMGNNGEIGVNNQLPWSMPADLAYFKKVTTGHTIVMGRKTYESIGRPLPNRKNVVLTRNNFSDERITVIHSLEEIKAYAHTDEEVFVIGGAEIFKELLAYTKKLYITKIHGDFTADTYFSPIEDSEWVLISEEYHDSDEKNEYPYTFCVYDRKNNLNR
ncbi:MAG: dihydrofolate reductase [Bacillaceae bacterium]